MKQSLSLTMSHNEISAFAFITWNVASLLMQSKNNLYRLAGWHIHKLHHRLSEKNAVVFSGKRKVRLNLCETLALHQFINYTLGEDDVYTATVRHLIFITIDKML